MQAIILAAGYATRLYPLTKDRPKPLLQLGNKTLVEYILDDFVELNCIDKVYIVTNDKFSSVFENWASEINEKKIFPQFDIVIVNDGTASNETRLGAIADIQFVVDKHKIDSELLVTAGDNVYKSSFVDMLAMYREKQADVVLAHPVDNLEKLQRSGIMELDENQQIIGFEEKPQQPKSNYVAPAFYLYRKETLPLIKKYLDEGNNPDAPGNFTGWLYQQKPVFAHIMQEAYYDIGTLEAYENVQKLFR